MGTLSGGSGNKTCRSKKLRFEQKEKRQEEKAKAPREFVTYSTPTREKDETENVS